MKDYCIVMINNVDLYDSYFPAICIRHVYYNIRNGIKELISKIKNNR